MTITTRTNEYSYMHDFTCTKPDSDKKSAHAISADSLCVDNYQIFPRVENENIGTVIANDGKEYNLKEIILSRLSAMLNDVSPDGFDGILPINDSLLQKEFILFDKTKNLKEMLQINSDYVYMTDDISQIFKTQTGAQYNPENIDKFLKGKLKLILEEEYESKFGKKAAYNNNPPFIKSKYAVEKSNKLLNKKRKTLNESEQISYAKIYSSLSKDMQIKFERCLDSGKLLLSNSNDHSTVLDNLYKMLTKPRANEIDKKRLIIDCINILDNPMTITQFAEDIPGNYIKSAVDYVYNSEEKARQNRFEIAKKSKVTREKIQKSGELNITKKEELVRIKKELEEREIGTCVAASIEYYIAVHHTAEFFRLVEGITSQNKEVKKDIDCRKSGLTDDVIDMFNTPYELRNGRLIITLKPDDGAYLLADIQKRNQDEDERTTVDILMQSLIFQIGTRGTYNSISDKHSSLFNDENSGLSDYEEDYILKLLTDKHIIYNEYKYIDDNRTIKLTSKNNSTESQINEYLEQGKSILVSIAVMNKSEYDDGHEITIIGKTKSIDGNEYYICKDTGLEYARPVLIRKDYMLKNIISSKVTK